MNAAIEGDVLTDGTWVRDGLVWRWVAAVHPEPEPIELKVAVTHNPSELIACPTCYARMDQRCKDRDGRNSKRSHDRRLVKRVCSCGGPVRMREPMCGFCRAEMAVAA